MRLLLLSILLLGACSSSAPPPADPLPALPLGIAFPPVGDAEQRAFTVDQLDALGVRHVRIGQRWAFREPERDAYNWGPLEARIASLSAAGVNVFLTLELKGWPEWLEALPPAEREAEFREYVRDLLARVGAGLEWVQFGNEWNWEVDRYAGGDLGTYVRYANILHDEVERRAASERPGVVLGSVSIGGLHGLALLQGRIDNVVFEGGPLYSPQEIAEAEREGPAALAAFRTVAGEIRYDAVDLHLYDDVWNWPAYRDAMEHLLAESGRDPDAFAYLVSEFGGPHPSLEPAGEAFAAERVEAYVRTLADMDVERAFFFQLVEEPGAEIAHPNSFLVDRDLRRTASFDVIARASQR